MIRPRLPGSALNRASWVSPTASKPRPAALSANWAARTSAPCDFQRLPRGPAAMDDPRSTGGRGPRTTLPSTRREKARGPTAAQPVRNPDDFKGLDDLLTVVPVTRPGVLQDR